MRSSGDLSMSEQLRELVLALVFAVSICLLTAARPVSAASEPQVTESEVQAAVQQLKADPNLATERTVRTLHWVDSKKPKPRSEFGSWFRWLGELMQWIAQSGRVIVWLAVGVLAALLVLLVIRLVREAGPRIRTASFDVPTHVRDLDIRPESLPDDIGGEAFSLWQQGQHRAALSLLYRGLLSRLAHTHQVPIRQSTTEGDCIQLAQKHLGETRSKYVAHLVRVWQLAVYGGHEPALSDVQELCKGFAEALAPPVSAGIAS
ncbi:MAG: DUF4129 domain-containing protein [Povalibacter sp.]